MIKKVLLLLTFIILISGCSNTKHYDTNKVVLDDIYYNKGNFININSDYLDNSKHKNYVLFAYNSFCTFQIPCEDIFQEYMTKYKVDFLSINIDEYKKTKLHDTVEYAPTIIIVKDGKIIAYLDAESDDDLNKYQDVKEFEKWINNYIFIPD